MKSKQAMRKALYHISLMLVVATAMSCDRTPHGVISVNDMADLIVDMQIADAYMESHIDEFPNDSCRQVMKQSIFKKHGITPREYDTSLVWYAHNMEDYVKAHDRALRQLQERHEKLSKNNTREQLDRLEKGDAGISTRGNSNKPLVKGRHHGAPSQGDTADLWQGKRRFMLTQGARHGYIPFDVVPDASKRPGDRYELAYLLCRGGNEFKVTLNVDYTDGGTAQISRSTTQDGWVTVDIQSDTARQVRRVYGYVSYNMQRGGVAYLDSLMLVRTHLDLSKYSFIHAQRLLERHPKR